MSITLSTQLLSERLRVAVQDVDQQVGRPGGNRLAASAFPGQDGLTIAASVACEIHMWRRSGRRSVPVHRLGGSQVLGAAPACQSRSAGAVRDVTAVASGVIHSPTTRPWRAVLSGQVDEEAPGHAGQPVPPLASTQSSGVLPLMVLPSLTLTVPPSFWMPPPLVVASLPVTSLLSVRATDPR